MGQRSHVVMSDGFHTFLTERSGAGGPDKPVADAFLTKRVEDGDHGAKDFFDFRRMDNRVRISYTTMARLVKAGIDPGDHDAVYAHKGHRVNGRAGSVAQDVTGITDGRALDVFAASLAQQFAELGDPQFVSGERCVWVYDSDNHCRCNRNTSWGYSGSMSCMTGKGPQPERFAIYVALAEMAIILCPDCGKITDRTLVWTLEDGSRTYDYLYGENAERLRVWLVAQGVDGERDMKVPTGDLEVDKLPQAPAIDYHPYWCKSCKALMSEPCDEHLDMVYVTNRERFVEYPARRTRGW